MELLDLPQTFVDIKTKEITVINGGWNEIINRGGLKSIFGKTENLYNKNACLESLRQKYVYDFLIYGKVNLNNNYQIALDILNISI